MSNISLTTSGTSGAITVSWDFSSLSGNSFNIELSRKLSTTTTVVHTATNVTTKTGSFLDNGAKDKAGPNPPAVNTTRTTFTTPSKTLKFYWNAVTVDTPTAYTYTLKITNTATQAVTTTSVVANVASGIAGYVYKVTDTANSANLTLKSSPTTGLSANVILENTDGLKYIHLATYDNSGNIGAEQITIIDVEAPTAPTKLTVNGQVVTTTSKPSIPYNPNGFSIDINPCTQIRSSKVYYDITFAVAGRTLYSATKTEYPTGIEWVGNILTEIPRLENDTQFIITVKSYTEVGSSLGTKQFSFILNRETINYTLDWTPNATNRKFLLNEADSIKISWSLTQADATITGYEVFVRRKQPKDINWGAWTSLGRTTDKYKIINGLTLNYTGNNVYSFAVTAYTATSTLTQKVVPGTYADCFFISASGTERFTVLAKLPMDTLKGLSISSSYKVSSTATPVTNNALVTVDGTGRITGKVGKFNNVNGTTIFPSLTTAGYDFTKQADVTNFENAVLNSYEMYRNTMDYQGTGKTISYTPDGTVDYYVVLVDIPNTDSRLNGITYNYDGLIGMATMGDVTISFNTPTVTTSSVSKNYKVLKFKAIDPPILSLKNSPTPVTTENGISSYRPPVSVMSTLPQTMTAYSANLRVVTSYDYNDASGSGTVENYVNGTPVSRLGSITFYSKLVYTYGSEASPIVKESREATLSFILLDTSNELIIPTLATEYVPKATGVDLLVFTNVPNTSKYTYILHDTNSDKHYTTYTTETDKSGNKVFRMRFTEVGEYDITLDYSLEGSGSGSQNIAFNVFAFEPATGHIVSEEKHSRLSDANENNGVHSVILKTNGLTSKNALYPFTYLNNTYFLKEGYQFPILVSGSGKVAKYVLQESERNKLVTSDGREHSELYTTNRTPYDNQTLSANLTRLTNTTNPQKPTMSFSLPNSQVISENDSSLVAKTGVQFPEYTAPMDIVVKYYIDGKEVPARTTENKEGKHVFVTTAISKNNYNYETTRKNVEIVSPKRFYPPRIDITPRYKSPTKRVELLSNNLVEPETATLTYKLSTTGNTIHTYTGPFTLNSSATITAIKTFPNGQVTQTQFTVPESAFKSYTATYSKQADYTTGNIAIPTINEQIGTSYEITVDGIPYTKWSAVKPIIGSTSKVRVIATEKRSGNKTTPQVTTITHDTKPPVQMSLNSSLNLKSSLKMIKLPPNTLATVSPSNVPTTNTTIYVDGVKRPLGGTLFPDTSKVDGVHTIVVINTNPINYTMSTTTYIINVNNYSTADSSYSRNVKRLAIRPLNRESGIFDTPGELMLDTRTGDISVVGENLQPIDITKSIRTDINSLDQIMGEINKSIEYIDCDVKSLRENLLSLFADTPTGLRKLSDVVNDIDTKVKSYGPPLETAVTNVKATKDTSDTRLNGATTTKNNLENGYSNLVTSTKQKVTAYPNTRNTLRNTTTAFLHAISEISQSYYNLTTINNVANSKVTKDAYNKFKSKNDNIYNSLVDIINRF